MTIVTAIFEDAPGKYHRCLRAFQNSIRETNPDARLDIITLEPPHYSIKDVKPGWIANHEKLKAFVSHGIHGDTIFCDVDTVFLRDAEPLFSEPFDIGIGVRPGGRVRYNGGVVLARETHEAREFLSNWLMVDYKMLYDRAFHQRWRAKYNGMNQASFGYMIENNPDTIRLCEYPTALMNACEQDWPRLGEISPVILHARKRLLRAAQADLPLERVPGELREAVRIWRGYEKR